MKPKHTLTGPWYYMDFIREYSYQINNTCHTKWFFNVWDVYSILIMQAAFCPKYAKYFILGSETVYIYGLFVEYVIARKLSACWLFRNATW